MRLSFSPGPNENIVVEVRRRRPLHRPRRRRPGRHPLALRRSRPITAPSAKIGSSLYATAKDNGVPDYIITEMMRVFAYDVDFQRQVQRRGHFEVFYGNPITGSSTKRKVLHYASLDFGGETKTYYPLHHADDGQTDYYDENWPQRHQATCCARRCRAPPDLRLRHAPHPLLGYSKMHTGVDFGAPLWHAASRPPVDGVIEVAGRGRGLWQWSSASSTTDNYETLYAHMSRLADGIRPGSKVNQGQIIGYVGSTGRSTGPHLHYRGPPRRQAGQSA